MRQNSPDVSYTHVVVEEDNSPQAEPSHSYGLLLNPKIKQINLNTFL
jgi:hypothetical protein